MSEEIKYKLEELESLTKILSISLETQKENLDARDVANIMELINEILRNILDTN